MHFPAPPARALAALLALAPACAPAPSTPPVASAAAPAEAPEQGAFITRLGTDTLFVERFTRTAGRLEGEVVGRSPVTTVRRYTAEVRPDGTLGRFEMTVEAPGARNPMPATRYTVEPGGDSLTVRFQRGDSTSLTRVAAGPGVLPFYRGSYALYEQALRQARASGRDSVEVLTYFPGAPRTSPLWVRITGSDAAVLGDIAGPVPARTDARGRIVAAGPTQAEMTVERVAALDVAALTAESARRDREGRGLGVLSPRDSLEVTVGGARIAVNYGRPLRRGRKIMGGVVPWGEVWRAGANEATHLRTDRDLVVGGVTVPAGSYTLWAIPSPSGGKLILNKRTGQWGTDYHPEDDLARVDLQAERVPQTVEQLTIGVEPRGEKAGVLAISWENTRFTVPFMVK
jgi:hypothetical protein